MSDLVVIAPEGELDISRLGEFRGDLSAAAAGDPARRLLVDLSSVSFIDSAGLGALVEFQNHLRREKRQLAILVPEGTAVAVMVTLGGLRGRLPIFETREAALEDLES